MSSARLVIKSLVEGLLGNRAMAALRGDGLRYLVLAYHNVVPGSGASIGDRSLHLGFDLFRKHLDVLGKRVAALDEVLAGTAPTGSVVITFDDAYASAVALALPELDRRGLPATVFIAPGLLGQGVPWWDAIAAESSGLSDEIRAFALDELEGKTGTVIKWAHSRATRLSSEPLCEVATVEDLDALRSAPRVTVGAHSWSHPNLLRANPETLQREITRTKAWLAEHFPARHRPWLAFPYGLYSEDIVRAASDHGYSATFAIRGGWFTAKRPDGAYPRLNVPAGLSARGLAARLNGFLIR